MAELKRTATTVSLLAELSHIFCCGLPILVAVFSAGSQIGLGGAFFVFHRFIHDYELQILFASGLLLAIGFGLHLFSYWVTCRETGPGHDHRKPKRFRIGWIFTIALILYVANLAFYFISGHGYEPPRFS
ncbi:MAG: hypothetical protein ACR2PG_09790 [Hyphomicrobiaceae bacterium]